MKNHPSTLWLIYSYLGACDAFVLPRESTASTRLSTTKDNSMDDEFDISNAHFVNKQPLHEQVDLEQGVIGVVPFDQVEDLENDALFPEDLYLGYEEEIDESEQPIDSNTLLESTPSAPNFSLDSQSQTQGEKDTALPADLSSPSPNTRGNWRARAFSTSANLNPATSSTAAASSTPPSRARSSVPLSPQADSPVSTPPPVRAEYVDSWRARAFSTSTNSNTKIKTLGDQPLDKNAALGMEVPITAGKANLPNTKSRPTTLGEQPLDKKAALGMEVPITSNKPDAKPTPKKITQIGDPKESLDKNAIRGLQVNLDAKPSQSQATQSGTAKTPTLKQIANQPLEKNAIKGLEVPIKAPKTPSKRITEGFEVLVKTPSMAASKSDDPPRAQVDPLNDPKQPIDKGLIDAFQVPIKAPPSASIKSDDPPRAQLDLSGDPKQPSDRSVIEGFQVPVKAPSTASIKSVFPPRAQADPAGDPKQSLSQGIAEGFQVPITAPAPAYKKSEAPLQAKLDPSADPKQSLDKKVIDGFQVPVKAPPMSSNSKADVPPRAQLDLSGDPKQALDRKAVDGFQVPIKAPPIPSKKSDAPPRAQADPSGDPKQSLDKKATEGFEVPLTAPLKAFKNANVSPPTKVDASGNPKESLGKKAIQGLEVPINAPPLSSPKPNALSRAKVDPLSNQNESSSEGSVSSLTDETRPLKPSKPSFTVDYSQFSDDLRNKYRVTRVDYPETWIRPIAKKELPTQPNDEDLAINQLSEASAGKNTPPGTDSVTTDAGSPLVLAKPDTLEKNKSMLQKPVPQNPPKTTTPKLQQVRTPAGFMMVPRDSVVGTQESIVRRAEYPETWKKNLKPKLTGVKVKQVQTPAGFEMIEAPKDDEEVDTNNPAGVKRAEYPETWQKSVPKSSVTAENKASEGTSVPIRAPEKTTTPKRYKKIKTFSGGFEFVEDKDEIKPLPQKTKPSNVQVKQIQTPAGYQMVTVPKKDQESDASYSVRRADYPETWLKSKSETAKENENPAAEGLSVPIRAPDNVIKNSQDTKVQPDQLTDLSTKALDGTFQNIPAPKSPNGEGVGAQSVSGIRSDVEGPRADFPETWLKSKGTPPTTEGPYRNSATIGTSVPIKAPLNQWSRPSMFPKKPDQESPIGQRALTGTFVKISIPMGPASTTLRQIAKSSINAVRQNNEVIRADYPQTWRAPSMQGAQDPPSKEPNQNALEKSESVPDAVEASMAQNGNGDPALIPVRPDQVVPIGARALKGTFVDITLPASADTKVSTLNATKVKVPPPDQTAPLGSRALEGTFVDVALPANTETNLDASKRKFSTLPDQSVSLGSRAIKGTFVDVTLPVNTEATLDGMKAKVPPPDQTAPLGSKAVEGTFVDVTLPANRETNLDASTKKFSTLPDQSVSLGSRAIKGTFVDITLPASTDATMSTLNATKAKVPPPDQTAPLGNKAVEGTFVDVTLPDNSETNLDASKRKISTLPDQSVSLGSRAIKGTFVDVTLPANTETTFDGTKAKVPPPDQTAPLGSKAVEGTFVDITLPTHSETNLDAPRKKISTLPDQSVSLGSRALKGTFVDITLPASADTKVSTLNATKVKGPPPDQTAPLGSRAAEGTFVGVTLPDNSETTVNASRKKISTLPDQSVSLGSRAMKGTFVDVTLPANTETAFDATKVKVPPPDQTAPLGSKAAEGTFVDVTLPASSAGKRDSILNESRKKVSKQPDQSVPFTTRAFDGTSEDVILPSTVDKTESSLQSSTNKIATLPDQSVPLAPRALRGTFVDVTLPASNGVKVKPNSGFSKENVSVLPDQARPIGALARKGTSVRNTSSSMKVTKEAAITENLDNLSVSDHSALIGTPVLKGRNVDNGMHVTGTEPKSPPQPSTKIPPLSDSSTHLEFDTQVSATEKRPSSQRTTFGSKGLPQVQLDDTLHGTAPVFDEAISSLYEKAALRQNEDVFKANVSLASSEVTSSVGHHDAAIPEKLRCDPEADESTKYSYHEDYVAVDVESTAEEEQALIEDAMEESCQSSIDVGPIDGAIQDGAEDTFMMNDMHIQNESEQAAQPIASSTSKTDLVEKARWHLLDGSTNANIGQDLEDELSLKPQMESATLSTAESSPLGQETLRFGAEPEIIDVPEGRLPAEEANGIEAEEEAQFSQEARMKIEDTATRTVPEDIGPVKREIEYAAEMATDQEVDVPSHSGDHPLSQAEHEVRPPIERESSNLVPDSVPKTPQDRVKVVEGDLISKSSAEHDPTSLNLEHSARNQAKLTASQDLGHGSMEGTRQVQQGRNGGLQKSEQLPSPNVESVVNAELRVENRNRFGRTMFTSRLKSDKRGRLSLPDQSVFSASRAFEGTYVDVAVNRTMMSTKSLSNSAGEVSPRLAPSPVPLRVDRNSRNAMFGQMNNPEKSMNRQNDLPVQAFQRTRPIHAPSPRRRKVWKQIPTAGGFRLVQVEEDIIEVSDANLFEISVNTTDQEYKSKNTTDEETINFETTHGEQEDTAEEEETVMDLESDDMDNEQNNIADESRQEEEERFAKQEKAKAAVARIKAFFEEQEPSPDSIVDQWLNYEKRWGTLPSASNALNEEEKELIKKRAKYYFARDLDPQDQPDPTVEGTFEDRHSLPSDPSQASSDIQKPTPFFAQRRESTSKGLEKADR